jgi:hypothetical protein
MHLFSGEPICPGDGMMGLLVFQQAPSFEILDEGC